jgi:serine/threonine protein kinase
MLRSGDRFADKYRIIRGIGQGGMGAVYLAEHELLGRAVAIKVLNVQPGERSQAVMRFEREIKALASVKSPYVAQAIDADTLEDGSPYLVMEYLEGRDLRAEVKRRGRIPFPEAIAYIVQACEGVSAAHSISIIHRDLKPHNLFVTHLSGNRQIKILDFGIAKFLDSSDPGLTATDLAVGTPLYMSPEQLCEPEAVSKRSDVWALGVVLYELIAGVSPFAANMPGAVVAAVTLEDPVPLQLHVPELPDAVQAIIEHALTKSYEHRIASVEELAYRLRPHGLPTDAIVAPESPEPAPRQQLTRESLRPELSAKIRNEIDAFEATSPGRGKRDVDALQRLPSLKKLSIPVTKPAVPVKRVDAHEAQVPSQLSIPVEISRDAIRRLHEEATIHSVEHPALPRAGAMKWRYGIAIGGVIVISAIGVGLRLLGRPNPTPLPDSTSTSSARAEVKSSFIVEKTLATEQAAPSQPAAVPSPRVAGINSQSITPRTAPPRMAHPMGSASVGAATPTRAPPQPPTSPVGSDMRPLYLE